MCGQNLISKENKPLNGVVPTGFDKMTGTITKEFSKYMLGYDSVLNRSHTDANLFYQFNEDPLPLTKSNTQTFQPDCQNILLTAKLEFGNLLHTGGFETEKKSDPFVYGVSMLNILLHPKSRG